MRTSGGFGDRRFDDEFSMERDDGDGWGGVELSDLSPSKKWGPTVGGV